MPEVGIANISGDCVVDCAAVIPTPTHSATTGTAISCLNIVALLKCAGLDPR